MAFAVAESCGYAQDVWLPSLSNIQANFTDVLGFLLYRLQEDSHVLEGKAAEYFGGESGGFENLCHIQALVQGLSTSSTN